MKRKVLMTILIISALFVSCGIPNIYVPESGNIIKKSTENGHARFYLSGPCVDPALVQDSFPTVCLFYQIVPKSSNSNAPFTNVISKFDSTWCNITDGIRINYKDEQPYFTSSYTSKFNDENLTANYGLYQLMVKYSDTITQGMPFAIAGLGNLVDNSYYDLRFSFDDTRNILQLCVNENPILIYDLYRYNGSEFNNSASSYIGSEIPSAYSEDQTITGYELKIYAVLSFEFNGYNNIYNTKTYEVFSYDLGLL